VSWCAVIAVGIILFAVGIVLPVVAAGSDSTAVLISGGSTVTTML